MQCAQVQQLLEEQGHSEIQDRAIARHVEQCPECQDYRDTLQLGHLLRTLPAPRPPRGFESRVVRNALREHRRGTSPRLSQWVAVAASVLLLVVVARDWLGVSLPGDRSLTENSAVAVAELQPVNVLLNSPRALEGATITVSLPPQLALKGHPDSQQVQWQADLKAGKTQLVLPLQWRSGVADNQVAAEEITIELQHNGQRKGFSVPVKVQPTEPGQALI